MGAAGTWIGTHLAHLCIGLGLVAVFVQIRRTRRSTERLARASARATSEAQTADRAWRHEILRRAYRPAHLRLLALKSRLFDDSTHRGGPHADVGGWQVALSDDHRDRLRVDLAVAGRGAMETFDDC